MVGLKKLTLNAKDAEFNTKDREQIKNNFFNPFQHLPNNLLLENLDISVNLEWKEKASKLEGWPLSHFFDRRYTKRCRNTVIDLKNDFIILDIKLHGFDMPDNLFPPGRLARDDRNALTTAEILEDVRCEKIKYPKHEWRKHGPVHIITIQDDCFELNIVDKKTGFKLLLKARALFGIDPHATYHWMTSFI